MITSYSENLFLLEASVYRPNSKVYLNDSISEIRCSYHCAGYHKIVIYFRKLWENGFHVTSDIENLYKLTFNIVNIAICYISCLKCQKLSITWTVNWFFSDAGNKTNEYECIGHKFCKRSNIYKCESSRVNSSRCFFKIVLAHSKMSLVEQCSNSLQSMYLKQNILQDVCLIKDWHCLRIWRACFVPIIIRFLKQTHNWNSFNNLVSRHLSSLAQGTDNLHKLFPFFEALVTMATEIYETR